MDSSPEDAGGRHVDLRYSQGAQIGDHNLMINHVAMPLPVVTWPVLAGRPPLRADAFQERPRLRDPVRKVLGHSADRRRCLHSGRGCGIPARETRLFPDDPAVSGDEYDRYDRAPARTSTGTPTSSSPPTWPRARSRHHAEPAV
jgi:hypothetical protein